MNILNQYTFVAVINHVPFVFDQIQRPVTKFNTVFYTAYSNKNVFGHNSVVYIACIH